jgi:hypothetical protein
MGSNFGSVRHDGGQIIAFSRRNSARAMCATWPSKNEGARDAGVSTDPRPCVPEEKDTQEFGTHRRLAGSPGIPRAVF